LAIWSTVRSGKYENVSNLVMPMGFHTCMHCTRLPFCTELKLWLLAENRVALLRPEKALTEVDSELDTPADAAANAAGATAAEAATTDAIAHNSRKLSARDGGRLRNRKLHCNGMRRLRRGSALMKDF
jgi:uncharacterized membrane protein YccC